MQPTSNLPDRRKFVKTSGTGGTAVALFSASSTTARDEIKERAGVLDLLKPLGG
jgi:hypothetical protein